MVLPEREDLISIGRVVRTQGIRGQIKVILYSGPCHDRPELKEVWLGQVEGTASRMRISEAKAHKKALVIKLEGIDSIDEAHELVSSEVMVPRSSLAALPEGEYYWFQLIGLKVLDEKGRSYGSIREIIETGSNDVYVARQGEEEFLIPATEDVIRNIDLEEGIIVIEPLPGLFDDHEI